MMIIRAAGIALALAAIGVFGVAVAVVTCAAVARMDADVAGFAFVLCSLPAVALAWTAWGGMHLLERQWPHLSRLGRLWDHLTVSMTRALWRAPAGATESVAFTAAVTLPPPSPPPLPVLGMAVAVPLAFLNLPGWMGLDMHIVSGPAAGAALFVVPGVVCGLFVGLLAQWLRQRQV